MAKTKAAAKRAGARATRATPKAKPPKVVKLEKPAAKTARTAKPPKATKPSLPLPPPPPPPPAQRDELTAERDVGRLLHYGERFGASKIDTRWLPTALPVGAAGRLAICDPNAPKSWRVLDRPTGAGAFRMMLSVARDAATNTGERLAAVVVHTGRPPIARWTVAHDHGQKRPKSVEQVPRVAVTSGWLAVVDAGAGSPGAIATPATPSGLAPVEIPLTDGRRAVAVPCANGAYAAYWAVDATDKAVCLVVDFEALTQKEWKAKAPA